MGRETLELTIYASVSRHNSKQDRIDDAAFARVRAKIEKLLKEEHEDGAFYSWDLWGG